MLISDAYAQAAAPAASANPSISFVDDAPTQEQDIEAKRALLAKPLDKMNKKEKRHATKLATALGKTLEQLAGQGLSADDEARLTASHQPSNGSSDQVMDTASSVAPAAVRAAEPFLSLDVRDLAPGQPVELTPGSPGVPGRCPRRAQSDLHRQRVRRRAHRTLRGDLA